jgi:tol-pal system protein YbgF
MRSVVGSRCGRALVAVACAALFAHAAHAALFDDEEARRRIEQTNTRLASVQKQLDDRIAALEAQMKSQGLMDLFREVEAIKADIAKLRGQFEVLAHEQEQAQKRQRDLYVDLDSRLRKLESAPGPVAGAPAASVAAPAPVPATPPAAAAAAPVAGSVPPAAPAGASSEQKSYDAALDQFRGGNYPAAIASFSAFVKAYPKSPLAPSAQYWIGNAQFAQRDFKGAIATQRHLVSTWPESQKVPDALLNIGTSQYELGEAAVSRRTLEELIAKYPQSEAAGKARQRLGQR